MFQIRFVVTMFCFWSGFAVMILNDFDMVSVTILVWVKIVILMWVKKVWFLFLSRFRMVLFGFWTQLEHISESYQTHISESYQNRIKTISKSCQNHKKPREIDQKPVPGLFLFPFLKPTHREPWKRRSVPKPYQNHTKSHPKPYLNHNPTISKPYQIHNKTTSKS